MSTADDIRVECATLSVLALDASRDEQFLAAQGLIVPGVQSIPIPDLRVFSRSDFTDPLLAMIDCKLALVAQGYPVEGSALAFLVLLKAGVYDSWRLRKTCDEIRDMLLAKNEAYGDSAMSPVRIFSRADPESALLVRIDDKLSRVARGDAAGEDVVLDMIGYLVLLRIARRRAGKAAS